MATKYEEIGGTPCECDCAQLGFTPDFDELNTIECKAYIVALRRAYGDPPKGVRFAVKANEHDFGVYREAVVKYDFDNLSDEEAHAAQQYVRAVTTGLARWDEARMSAPAYYGESGKDVLWRIKSAEQIPTLFWENAMASIGT
jgi:hypothetical protein